MGGQAELKGPDLEKDGVDAAALADGAMLEGHAAGEAVLVVRRGADVFAVGATCTHYGGPLAEGIVTGHLVRCPWHHACFDLRTGESRAPALNPVACWKVETRGAKVFVAGKVEPAKKRLTVVAPKRVVVLGAGAAGACAVELLRHEGFDGDVALVGRDDVPVDRPNLSKDYLAGSAPEEWIPLRGRDFYAEKKIDVYLDSAATAIDTKAKTVTLANGKSLAYDTLLYATGADPIRLSVPGADLDHVLTLRTLADSRAIIARATGSEGGPAKRAVVVGASFIGLEVAASLRARGIDVDVVAPEAQPLEKVLGGVGAFVRALHEAKGVRFHLGRKPASIARDALTLDDGSKLACDFVVMGVGVRPAIELAKAAGIAVDGGVLTDEYLETSEPGVFAAGDVARYAIGNGERQRVEHWVHAERQGAVAALNILGRKHAFTHVPFFWSVHYDVTISYVGHAETWDAMQVSGNVEKRDAIVALREGGAIRAVATIGRDRAALLAEAAMERGDVAALEALMK